MVSKNSDFNQNYRITLKSLMQLFETNPDEMSTFLQITEKSNILSGLF